MRENPILPDKHFATEKKLHTDFLEEKYGPINVRIEHHDDSVRESHLEDKDGVSRTYALTFFPDYPANEEVAEIDKEIREGGAIGKTFRKYGYEIRKNVIDAFVLDLPGWLKDDFQTELDKAKARISEFYAKKEESLPVIYGTVLEVYSPDFRSAGVNDFDRDQINPSTGAFLRAGVSMDKIWSKLPDASQKDEWRDISDLYDKAKKSSEDLINNIHRKISEYFEGR